MSYRDLKRLNSDTHAHTHISGRQLKIIFLDVSDYSKYSEDTNISNFFSRKHSFLIEESKTMSIFLLDSCSCVPFSGGVTPRCATPDSAFSSPGRIRTFKTLCRLRINLKSQDHCHTFPTVLNIAACECFFGRPSKPSAHVSHRPSSFLKLRLLSGVPLILIGSGCLL